jgi:uroporphyrinogen-III synthase
VPAPGDEALRRLQVVGFESRRAEEMATLVRRYGGEPLIAPSMREVPLAEQPEALAFARALDAGEIDVVILLTGVGTRTMAAAVAEVLPRARFAAALGRTRIVARGPKPIAALRELGLTPALAIPEPNTWREVLAGLDAHLPVAGRRVAVQEYGVANPDLLAGLAARGASVLRVPVYRWALPEDLGPLRRAIARVAGGEIDVALFTSATQIEHLMHVAGEEGGVPAEKSGLAVEQGGVAVDRSTRDALRAGFARAVVGSVGPVCSEALRGAGLTVDLEPSHPKMGPLVAETLRAAPALLAVKRTLRQR